MRILLRLFAVITFTCAFGIAQADDWKDESGKGKSKDNYEAKDSQKDRDKEWKKERKERQKEWKEYSKGKGDSYFQRQGYSRLDIPQGHYPPPGECRIWFPDRPAGHQPPPRKNCSQVPPGAWVIHHPADSQNHVEVAAYELETPGEVIAVGEFDIASGVFIRVIVEH